MVIVEGYGLGLVWWEPVKIRAKGKMDGKTANVGGVIWAIQSDVFGAFTAKPLLYGEAVAS